MSDKPTLDTLERAPLTLANEDISTDRSVGRRSVLTVIGATTLGAVAAVTGGCIVARTRSGINDADPADPAGNGRGGVVVAGGTGISDADSADPAGQGRGAITDGDGGAYADPGGRGRGAPHPGLMTGITDGDSGRWSDPGGAGRGPRR